MSLVIAGERSGVGKTTVTLSLLAALRHRQRSVQSFKVGPDYIDPMFHHHVTGLPCRNLDPVLTSEAYVQQCFNRHTQTVDCALVEGVMGLFDGATGADDFASTAHIARLLDLPVLLVLDCSRLARSIAAIAHGYKTFDPRLNLAGVVLNRVGSDRHLDLLKTALESLNIPVLGVLRRQDDITIPDRYLGLVPTAELAALDDLINRLAALAEACFNWDRLLPLLKCNTFRAIEQQTSVADDAISGACRSPSTIKLAVARDRAFSFYYPDNLELLQTLGAELVEWSPLNDPTLPEGVHGLYFGGGFPEVFAAELSANQSAQAAVKAAIQAEMPVYAECGGLMYLCEQIIDFEGRAWRMVGILPTIAKMGDRLTLGYRKAVTLCDTPLMPAGATAWGHEFHRSTLSNLPQKPLYQLSKYDPDYPVQSEGWQRHKVHASYVHMHWGGRPDIPRRFLSHCAHFAYRSAKT